MTSPHGESTAVGRRKQRTALGYRRFSCTGCRRRFNERTGTLFNELQFPTDIVLLAVLWRLHYKLGPRDAANLRSYVAAVANAAASGSHQSASIQAWISWAGAVAGELDPVVSCRAFASVDDPAQPAVPRPNRARSLADEMLAEH